MDNVIFSPITKDELSNLIDIAVTKAMQNFKEPLLNDELISRSELKEYVGIASDTTIIRLEKLNIFSPIRIGRKLFYRKNEVKNALDKLKK